MNNQPRKVRPEIIDVNGDNPVFYLFSVKTSKCSGNCNNINDPYAKKYVFLILQMIKTLKDSIYVKN